MIERGFCLDELERLSHLRGFPQSEAAINDMVNALKVSESEPSARKLIDDVVEFLTAGQQCPTAGDIRRMAWERKDVINREREKEYQQWKRDERHPTAFMTGKGWDQEFLRLYKMRLEELKDHTLDRFHPDDNGQHHRKPTEVSRQMEVVVQRLRDAGPKF